MDTDSKPSPVQRLDSETDDGARYARRLIEVSRNPLVSIDPQGRIIDANAATVEAVGIPRNQLIGSDFADCFSEPEEARAAYQLVLEDGLLSDYHLVLRHVSGALTEVEYNAAVYRDAGGEPRAVFAAARDAAEAQEARRQVARLALVVASSHDAIHSRDLDGEITSWNAAAEALYGYSAEEAIGVDGTILLTPGREGDTKALINRVLREDRGFGFATQHQRKDGSQVDVVLSLSALRDAAGDITGITFISRDVREQMRADRDLRESEQKFAAAFQASPDLMMITRLSDGLVLEINEGFTRLLGYERAETVGRTTAELAIWVDPQVRDVFVASLEASGETGETETVLRRRDGTLITGVYSARSMEVQGEACVLSVVHDVTEHRQAEAALREDEERWRFVLQASQSGAWDLSLVDHTAFRTLHHDRIFGYDTLLPEWTFEMFLEHVIPEDRADVDRKFQKAIREGGDWDFECRILRRDGEQRWISASGQHRRDAQGQVLSMAGMVHDITERKKAEEELLHHAEQLQRHAEQLQRHAEQLQRTVEGAVLAMSHMVESRDPYTAGHERRVTELATAIGAEMGMKGGQLDALRLAATIHDVGKIGVPAEILSKPSRLNEIEFGLIKAHAKTGSEILADVDFGSPVAEMVLQHHERLDGSGYPRGLKGEDVMAEARILAVADVVEAMSSHRPYRAALGMDAALAEVREHAGVKYDVDVVDVCTRLFEKQGFQFTP